MTAVGGKKVLLVDDEVAVRNLYQLLLERAGMVVFTAAGVLEASQLSHDLDFDAAVVDLHLLDGDGVSLIRQIRRAAPKVKILAMSGYPLSPELQSEMQAAGARFYNKLDPLAELVRLLET